MLKAENVSKVYLLGESRVTALADVSVTIEAGMFAALAGPSGSGKSTLLNILGAIEQPTRGKVQMDGLELTALSSDAQADLRAHRLGFVFQTFNLLPVLTAFENVEYPLTLGPMPFAARQARVKQLLEEVGLAAFARHRPTQLSGGQRQRVAIARALAASPAVILADEPTANLDRGTGAEIIQLLKKLNRAQKMTVLISSHDHAVLQEADRVFELASGKLVNA